jgi:hypothetical protein
VLLPYDFRADREGWTVFEVETQRPAIADGVPMVGLSLEEAEELTNALNSIEMRCGDIARRKVLEDLGIAWTSKWRRAAPHDR